MDKHTKESWDDKTCRRMEAGQQTFPTSFPYHAVWEVNYARAVACVNACAGMSDPAGEIGRMRAALLAAVKYDAAIRRRVVDGAVQIMATGGGVAMGDDLDELYDSWQELTRAALLPAPPFEAEGGKEPIMFSSASFAKICKLAADRTNELAAMEKENERLRRDMLGMVSGFRSHLADLIRRIGPARRPEDIKAELEDIHNNYNVWGDKAVPS